MPHEATVCRHATIRSQLASHKRCAVAGLRQHQAPNRPIDSSRDYLWVSDHALQQAYDRFAARSLSCRTQKRFGSHVPGPLEARRRLAKRRLAVYMPTAPQDVNLLSSSLAGMRIWLRNLGLGQETHPWEDVQWQPPWATRDGSFPVDDTGLSVSHQTSSHEPISRDAEKSQEIKGVSIPTSENISFEELITRCKTLGAVVDACSISSPSPGTDTHRAEVVLQFLSEHAMFWTQQNHANWSTTMQALLVQCFRAFEGGMTAASSTARFQSMLDGLEHLQQLYNVLPVWFGALQAVDAEHQFRRGLQHAAIRVLRSHKLLGKLGPIESGPIAPQHFARCFVKFDPVALGSVLLQCTANTGSKDAWLRPRMLTGYMQDITDIAAVSFEDVVLALARSAKELSDSDNWRLTSWLYIFVYKQYGEAGLIHLVRQLGRPELRGKLARPAITRLLHYLAPVKPRAVVRIFKSSHCYVVDPTSIIMSLMDSEVVTSHDIMYVLWHSQRLSMVYEKTNARNEQRLSSARIRLISNVALKFASSKHLPPNVAYRHVYYCYRYLIDYGAPVTKEVVEALYTAGVTRPLEAREGVSTTKFTWIIRLVGDFYGPETAEKLDRMTYQWREQVRIHQNETRRQRWLSGRQEVQHVVAHQVPKRRYGVTLETTTKTRDAVLGRSKLYRVRLWRCRRRLNGEVTMRFIPKVSPYRTDGLTLKDERPRGKARSISRVSSGSMDGITVKHIRPLGRAPSAKHLLKLRAYNWVLRRKTRWVSRNRPV